MPKYKFSDIAENITEKGIPSPGDEVMYIGLEHLDSGSLKVSHWGSDVPIKGQKLIMRQGDILFGRRNTYLRRAAIAPHDGFFSAHGMIFRPKEKVIDPVFFPFFISSSYFMDEAIRISVGSLSPTVNWKTLKELEFVLPDMDEQRKLAEILSAANEAKEAYKELLRLTDELVKSQFIEMFGTGYSTVRAGTVMRNMRNGLSPSKKGKHYEKILTLSAVTQGEFDADAWKDGFFDECPSDEKRVREGEFYICRGNGNKSLVGTGVYAPEDRKDLVFPDTVIATCIDEERICLPYLCNAWKQQSVRSQIEVAAKTTNGTYKINQKAISDIEIILPPLYLQHEFADFVAQTDKSKFELKQAIDNIDGLINSLLKRE